MTIIQKGERMSDLISRQAAIDAVHEEFDDCLVWDESGQRTADEFEIIINRLPPAQPEITHCAECIHWKHSDVRKNYCEVFDWTNKAKDFCSFAERREE